MLPAVLNQKIPFYAGTDPTRLQGIEIKCTFITMKQYQPNDLDYRV